MADSCVDLLGAVQHLNMMVKGDVSFSCVCRVIDNELS